MDNNYSIEKTYDMLSEQLNGSSISEDLIQLIKDSQRIN